MKLRRWAVFAVFFLPVLVVGMTMLTLNQLADGLEWLSGKMRALADKVESWADWIIDLSDVWLKGITMPRHPTICHIIINAVRLPWPPGEITFEQIIAHTKQPAQATVTVSYPDGSLGNRILSPGQSAPVRDGMIVGAIVTGSA